jgi:L-ornithine N5-monooxygenase
VVAGADRVNRFNNKSEWMPAMTHQLDMEYDVVGVGFGPSNLALAIALSDRAGEARSKCRFHFIEKQRKFIWHGGMLLPGTDMQISFLKDLVSLRDPTSPLTFVNYLHKKGRLEDFINCKTFYPSRVEFNDYLGWVACHFKNVCSYGETTIAVEPVTSGQYVTSLRIRSRTAAGHETIRHARNLVVAVGGTPHVPGLFSPVADDARLLHSSRYLDTIGTLDLARRGARAAVIGGGQSATEVTVDLHNRFPELGIDLVFRGHALKPSDSSPFVNEIFNPTYTDFIFSQPDERRDMIVRNFRNTNYAVVDPDLLDQLYRILYQHKVDGLARIALRPRSALTDVVKRPNGIEIGIKDDFAGLHQRHLYDVVILATGYERSSRHPFLQALEPYIQNFAIDREYRLATVPAFKPQIHLHGYSETSHGLSDTLLSVVALRSQEIADSLLQTAQRRELIA